MGRLQGALLSINNSLSTFCQLYDDYMPIISLFTVLQEGLISLQGTLLSIQKSLPIFCQLYDNYMPILQWFKRIWLALSELWYQSTIACLFSARYDNYMPIISWFTIVLAVDLSYLEWSFLSMIYSQFSIIGLNHSVIIRYKFYT